MRRLLHTAAVAVVLALVGAAGQPLRGRPPTADDKRPVPDDVPDAKRPVPDVKRPVPDVAPDDRLNPRTKDTRPAPATKKDDLPFLVPPDPRARTELGALTRDRAGAVLLAGYPKAGHGTAWVLSSQHRLLVTNAHVADIMGAKGTLLAIADGSRHAHEVKKVYYHPGVRRRLPGGKVSIRADCPADGEVDPMCPDLAVLELEPGGPPLPPELPMAGPDELKTLLAQTVGMYGFPGHSASWPGAGEKAQGSYTDGVVSRMTNFRLSGTAAADDLQFVQTTLGNFPGYSGSPVYLANGRVAAINNSVRLAESKGVTAQVSHAVRVDSLWELLVYHKLDEKVPLPVDRAAVRHERWRELDESERRFRRAVALVDEASTLVDFDQKFGEAVKKCDQAAELAPDYPHSYRVRCAARNAQFAYDRAANPRAVLEAAYDDAEKYFTMMKSDPAAVIALVNTACNLTAATRNQGPVQAVLPTLNRVASSDALPKPVRAEFVSLRGTCLFNLQQSARARDDFNDAIRLDPENAFLFDNRARFWEAVGNNQLAEQDRATARALRKKELERVLRKKD